MLAGRDLDYRQRIVHHMVLGELVLRPIPTVVAHRVAQYAEALGVKDDFVRVARRYAQGAYGLAWMDLAAQRLRRARRRRRRRRPTRADAACDRTRRRRSRRRSSIPSSPRRWAAFADLPDGDARVTRCGRCTTAAASSYRDRPVGRRAYLAQHDFVHVLADYGTNLRGELEVFAFIGRADPDPKGFAWLATLTGLFETGYIPTTGLLRPRRPRARDPGAGHAPARRRRDPPRQGGVRRAAAPISSCSTSTLIVERPVAEVARDPGRPPKGTAAVDAGSVGPFDARGDVGDPAASARATPRRHAVKNKNFSQVISVRCDDPAPIIALLEQWDADQAATDIMGYMGIRVLADRENPGEYLIIADFGVVDPDVSAADEAQRNNERPETQATSARMREFMNDDPGYRHYDELYRTDF